MGLPQADFQYLNMKKLIFATHNAHKVEEIRAVIGDQFEIIGLSEAGIESGIPEPHDTLEANASEKSWFIYRLTGQDCFSDDTGLEVDVLGGEPGVNSARYAGDDRSPDKNIEKLLAKMEGHTNRKARFKAVISLILNGHEFLFEGVCRGRLIHAPKGGGGFGYDPIFVPEIETRTFAEMSLEEKNRFNHRRRAVDKLVTFLQKHGNKTEN